MSRRALASALGLGLILALACTTVASAKYRGTDMWDNIMPASGAGGLVDRYPLSHYQLDYHVDSPVGFGGFSASNAAALIGQVASSIAWFMAVLLIRLVITIFMWAFNADLISGPRGGLAQTSAISQSYYGDFVRPFMAVFIICFGAWLGWKTFKSHERSDAGQAVLRVIVLSVLSMSIVFHPQETVGRAFSEINGVSEALVARGGDSNDVANAIFSTFVYKPWAVLQFSSLKVCTGAHRDDDGFPLAATTDNPAKVCHSVLHKDADGHGDYAQRFLRYAPDSDERKAEYDALREGKAPDTPQFSDVTIDRTDAPAVDMMQAGGALQRFVYVALMIVCIVFGALLLGLLSIASLFAQIALLVLVLIVVFMILAALFPPLHGIYMKSLSLLRDVLVGKAVFALLLAVVFSTSGILLKLGGQDGYFVAFGVQALLFGGVFIKRKAILAKATSSKAAQHYSNHENHAVAAVAGAATTSASSLSGGASTFIGTMRSGWSGDVGGKNTPSGAGSPVDSSSPPASAGREHSPPGPPADNTNTHSTHEGERDFTDDREQPRASRSEPSQTTGNTNDGASGARGGQTMPIRPFATDLANARASQYDEEHTSENGVPPRPSDPPPTTTPVRRRLASASTFQQDLDDARREQGLERRE